MSRIPKTIQSRLAKGGKVLIPYFVAGDPALEVSLQLMHGLVAAGADIIELGIPFSDPSSDGEVIQRGAERSLAAGTCLADVIGLVEKFRAVDTVTPVVLMGYLNPIEIMGYDEFVLASSKAGVDGVLVVDMPPNESDRLRELLVGAGMDLIFLVAPTTSPARARMISARCSGYLYYVSLKGVTGAAITDTASIERNVALVRELSPLPVVIGFGIKDAEGAAAMARLADGVVIGSALVTRIAGLGGRQSLDATDLATVTEIIRAARARLDQAG